MMVNLKRILSAIDRTERNKINENYDEIELEFTRLNRDVTQFPAMSEEIKLTATEAKNTATDALSIANNIDNKATQAINTANAATTKSNTAVNTANEALQKSESTQTQLDTIVISGDSSVEAAQARIGADGTAHSTLKDRIDSEIGEVAQQLAHEANLKAKEMEIREVLMKQTFKARTQLSNATNIKPVLLLGYPDTSNERERGAYTICKRILFHAKIAFKESTINISPTDNNVTEYGVVLIAYALVADITRYPDYFDGRYGVPTIVAAGGAGWHSYPEITGVASVQTDGVHHFHMPGGRDFYTHKGERFNVATLNLNLTTISIEKVIYDPIENNKAFVWIVRKNQGATLYCSNYNASLIGPWLLYYIRQWGGYSNAIPLTFCVDLDDVNQVTTGNVVEVDGLKDLYDWCKEVDLVITSGIKTDQMVDENTRFPKGEPTPQTIFARDHQDVFIPIVHDHNYAYQGGKTVGIVKTWQQLMADHEERLKVAHDYGFAIPRNMWGYLFQPWNNYTDHSIVFWKNIGIKVARDAGSGEGVYSSNFSTIPESVREDLAESHFMWVNTNQYVPALANSIQDTLNDYGLTIEEWYGMICLMWVRTSTGSFPPSAHKNNIRLHEPSFSVLYAHGNNVNGDNPFLVGLRLGDNIRKSFRNTVIYSHPASVVGRSTITNLKQ